MQIITTKQFKQLVRTNKNFNLESTLVTKDSATNRPEIIDDRQVKFTISTPDVDRHNDSVLTSAWQNLDAYMKNPVVLWGHDDTSPPIARCVDIKKDKNGLYAIAEFVPRDMPYGAGEKAEMCLRMLREGFLQATSVGFIPLDWEETKDESRGADGNDPGFDFKSADLMEFSIVPIPANPHALIMNNIKDVQSVKNSTDLLNKKKRLKRLLDVTDLVLLA